MRIPTYASIAAACFLAISPTSAAEFIWGASGHPLSAYPGVTIERQFEHLKDLGLKSYRVNIANASSADGLAELVSKGKEYGISLLPVITPDGMDMDKDTSDQLYAAAHRLAFDLGARFKGEIPVWELGNEMENYAIIRPCEKRDDGTQYPCEWGAAGGVGPLDYYGPRWAKVSAVLRGLSDGIAEADPEARNAIGTAGWGHLGAFERMKQDGIQWDISVWHMYGEDPQLAFSELARYGKPIWVTEFNHPYGSQRSETQQAEGLTRSMKRIVELRDSYQVEAAFVYELMDETYWAPSFEAFMGLVRLAGSAENGWSAGTPKPAYFAVRDLIRGPQPLPTPQRDCELEGAVEASTVSVRRAKFAYCLILGRTATEEEINRWSGDLGDIVVDAPQIMLQLMRDGEFRKRYSIAGMSDRAYVSFLYRLLADRDADEDGLGSYVRQLKDGSMTREDVALGMMTSEEFSAKHAAYLDARLAAPAGTVASR